jgi:hypothetical protein
MSRNPELVEEQWPIASIVSDWAAAPQPLAIYALEMILGRGFVRKAGAGASGAAKKRAISEAWLSVEDEAILIDLKIGDYSKSWGTEYLFDADNQVFAGSVPLGEEASRLR